MIILYLEAMIAGLSQKNQIQCAAKKQYKNTKEVNGVSKSKIIIIKVFPNHQTTNIVNNVKSRKFPQSPYLLQLEVRII